MGICHPSTRWRVSTQTRMESPRRSERTAKTTPTETSARQVSSRSEDLVSRDRAVVVRLGLRILTACRYLPATWQLSSAPASVRAGRRPPPQHWPDGTQQQRSDQSATGGRQLVHG